MQRTWLSDKAGQRTGKVAEFPNWLLLTHPLINSTPNGAYALHATQIPIPIPERVTHALGLDRIEAAALAAAEHVTTAWQEEAMARFHPGTTKRGAKPLNQRSFGVDCDFLGILML